MGTGIKNREQIKPTKGRKIGYWVVTGLLISELLYGALWDLNLVNKGYVYDMLNHLGYPLYLAAILAVGKIIAAIIIVSPGIPLIKEWAYSGIIILFLGGLISHISAGDSPGKYVFVFLFLVLSIASWMLRYRDRIVKDAMVM